MTAFINFPSGGQAYINSKDMQRITPVLDIFHQAVDRLYYDDHQEHIQCLSAAVCVLATGIFYGSGLPQEKNLVNPSEELHPLRSLIYYGQSRLCEKFAQGANFPPHEFISNRLYFADTFLLHEAVLLQQSRNQDSPYFAALERGLEEKIEDYGIRQTSQNLSYAQLCEIIKLSQN